LSDELEGVQEAPPMLLVPILICAAYVILLGLSGEVPGMPFSIARVAVEHAFGLPSVTP